MNQGSLALPLSLTCSLGGRLNSHGTHAHHELMLRIPRVESGKTRNVTPIELDQMLEAEHNRRGRSPLLGYIRRCLAVVPWLQALWDVQCKPSMAGLKKTMVS